MVCALIWGKLLAISFLFAIQVRNPILSAQRKFQADRPFFPAFIAKTRIHVFQIFTNFDVKIWILAQNRQFSTSSLNMRTSQERPISESPSALFFRISFNLTSPKLICLY